MVLPLSLGVKAMLLITVFSVCRGCDRSRRSGRAPSARFCLFLASSDGGCVGISYDVDPLRVGRGLLAVVVVPIPPLVRLRLRITLRRVLPSLLATERRNVEVAPDSPHRLIAAIVDEVCAEHLVAVAEEHIVT